MRTLAGILLVLAVAPAASAETVARRTAAAGPALAGDAVAWGEEKRSGAVRVLRGSPGAPPQVVHEIPAATAAKTRRGFMSLPSSFGASAEAFAALTYTATTVFEESDSVTDAYELAAIGGPLTGPGAVLAGSIPPRVVPACHAHYANVEGVAVDGARIAVATSAGACDSEAPPQLAISVHDPAGRRDVAVPGGIELVTVRLAGDYLLWVQHDRLGYDEIVLHDLARSVEAARVRLRELGAREGRNAAVQADGTVAFAFTPRRGRSRLAWFTAADPRLRVIDPRGWVSGLALDGGRALYERELRARFASEVVLRRLAGGKPRRLARYGARQGRVGTLDLDPARAAWAVEPRRRSDDQPTGRPGRIVLRAL